MIQQILQLLQQGAGGSGLGSGLGSDGSGEIGGRSALADEFSQLFASGLWNEGTASGSGGGDGEKQSKMVAVRKEEKKRKNKFPFSFFYFDTGPDKNFQNFYFSKLFFLFFNLKKKSIGIQTDSVDPITVLKNVDGTCVDALFVSAIKKNIDSLC